MRTQACAIAFAGNNPHSDSPACWCAARAQVRGACSCCWSVSNPWHACSCPPAPAHRLPQRVTPARGERPLGAEKWSARPAAVLLVTSKQSSVVCHQTHAPGRHTRERQCGVFHLAGIGCVSSSARARRRWPLGVRLGLRGTGPFPPALRCHRNQAGFDPSLTGKASVRECA